MNLLQGIQGKFMKIRIICRSQIVVIYNRFYQFIDSKFIMHRFTSNAIRLFYLIKKSKK